VRLDPSFDAEIPGHRLCWLCATDEVTRLRRVNRKLRESLKKGSKGAK
jgi:hypothetical protein